MALTKVTFSMIDGAIVNVLDFGAVGDGVTNDYAAITLAIAHANSIGCILFFPPGVYLTTTTLVFKNNVIYRGSGISGSGTLGTRIYYTGTSDAIQINNPINSSTSANIVIEDIYVQCATRTAGKASIADVGSTYLTLNRVRVYGNDYGVILDQSEIVRLQDCNIGVTITTGSAGVWLVNNDAHTPGASAFFTNRIIIDGCQFDASTNGQCIADDGGVSHTFSNNNFNAGSAAIRLTNVQGLLISGNEIETTTNASISFNVTTLASAVGNYCTSVTVNSNYFSNSSAIPFIIFQSSSVQKYIGCGNTFNNANAGGAPYSGVAAGVFDFYGAGNFQTGAGSTVVGNTVGPLTTYTPTFASSVGDAALGNGTISGSYTRTGANITVNINFAVGSTTTKGTGQWRFGLPFASAGSIICVGSFVGLSAGATFRAGASDVNGGLNYVRRWENTVGPLGGASYAWANGDFVYITITYPVSQAL